MARLPKQRQTSKTTLEQWLKQPGATQHTAITTHAPRVGIHDVPAIAHVRTYLWDLADYWVQSVQAGVIWLAPRTLNKWHLVTEKDSKRIACKDCGNPAYACEH